MQPRQTALACAALALVPTSIAHAQMQLAVAAFGRHTTTPIDLVSAPVGSPECDLAIPITISGLAVGASGRVLDVWWTSSDAACDEVAAREGGLCTPVTIDASTVTASDTGMALDPSVHTLYADLASPCSGALATRTFFFFDASTSADLTTTFTASTSSTLAITLDTIAPTAPALDGDAVGDTALTAVWSASPTPTGVRFYVDSNACGHDAAPRSSIFSAGGASVASTLVYSVDGSPDFALGQTTFDTSALAWSTERYGETGAMAMTVVDELGNESPLSNLVCVYHARCTGDAGGSSDCGPTGFCAVSAIGGDRPSSAWAAACLACVIAFVRRARRQSVSAH